MSSLTPAIEAVETLNKMLTGIIIFSVMLFILAIIAVIIIFKLISKYENERR